MAHVIEALAEPDTAPQDDDRSSSLARVNDAVRLSADDSGQGLSLFALFISAVLAVTGAVGILALLTSWWVLGVVFGVHVLFTAIVGTAVFGVLSSSEPSVEGDNIVHLGATEGPVQSRATSNQTSPMAA